jgi:hypothetical protein
MDVDVAADHARVLDRDGADRFALFAADPRSARINASLAFLIAFTHIAYQSGFVHPCQCEHISPSWKVLRARGSVKIHLEVGQAEKHFGLPLLK